MVVVQLLYEVARGVQVPSFPPSHPGEMMRQICASFAIGAVFRAKDGGSAVDTYSFSFCAWSDPWEWMPVD